MNKTRIEALLLIPLIVLVAFAIVVSTGPVESYNSPSARYPETAPGFKKMDNIVATTTAAIKIGTIPTGYKMIHVRSVGGDVNYGDSAVGTGTTHLYIPDNEARTIGYFDRPNPELYFRVRGTTASTIYIDAGPTVVKPW